MKYYFLYFACFITLAVNSQDSKTAIIKVDTSLNAEAISIPFSEISVLDARFDRTKIGCIYNSVFLGYLSLEKREVNFPDSFHRYFPRILNSFIKTDPSNKNKLIVLVKQFRIANHILRGIESDPVEIELTLRFSVSFYALNEDKCYRLFSIDNVSIHHIEKVRERKRRFEEGTRAIALQVMLHKLLKGRNWHLNSSQAVFTLNNMKEGIENRFKLPVYVATFKKGVYKTFTDFKNNNPSTEDFTVVYKNNKIDYLKNKDGKPYSPDEIWGICDGTKNYLYLRDEYCELIPSDRGFKVFSYATRSELAGSVGSYDLMTATLGKIKDKAKLSQYFDLDMETGKLYLQEIFGKSSVTFQ